MATPWTLDRILERFPWPAALRALAEPLEFVWHFDLPLTPTELWPLLADTSRFNRDLGLPAMRFTEVDGGLAGEASYGGCRGWPSARRSTSGATAAAWRTTYAGCTC
jgi:hypothetical protein